MKASARAIDRRQLNATARSAPSSAPASRKWQCACTSMVLTVLPLTATGRVRPRLAHAPGRACRSCRRRFRSRQHREGNSCVTAWTLSPPLNCPGGRLPRRADGANRKRCCTAGSGGGRCPAATPGRGRQGAPTPAHGHHRPGQRRTRWAPAPGSAWRGLPPPRAATARQAAVAASNRRRRWSGCSRAPAPAAPPPAGNRTGRGPAAPPSSPARRLPRPPHPAPSGR